MFQKLRRQMTFFCALVTGVILVAMSLACLWISEDGMRKNEYQSFLNDLNSVVSYLENQTVISNQWLAKTESNQQLMVDVYDNGESLFYNSLQSGTYRSETLNRAREAASGQYGLDISRPIANTVLSQSVQFTMLDESGKECYAAAAVFPKTGGFVSAVIVRPLWERDRQILMQRLLFAGIDLVGLAVLTVFSGLFTGRMLRPLEESRKRQSQFVAAASHELRSPLAVMLSNLSALQKAEPEERAGFEENIRAEGQRMSRLVDDMLALANADSKSWSIRRAPQDIDTLLLNLYERYQGPAREKGVTLKVELPEETLPKCSCDAGRIEQVLAVLVDNALSYTPRGGRVNLSVARQGNRFEIAVADNGPGVPDEEKKHIFERFYRVDSAHRDKEHFGLGLCVAQEIISLHKGRLWVEDTPGGGATFRIQL